MEGSINRAKLHVYSAFASLMINFVCVNYVKKNYVISRFLDKINETRRRNFDKYSPICNATSFPVCCDNVINLN